MRHERSVTALSWIPSEAIKGSAKLPFELGIGSYDSPPPDRIDDLDELHARGAFRFANVLRAWIEVDAGAIAGHGYSGRSLLSLTHFRVGPIRLTFAPTGYPDLRAEPEVGPDFVTFIQTAGGRPGMPAPRVLRDRPFVSMIGPNVWTTLTLTIHADGSSEGVMTGASSFPRHWIYDNDGLLVSKSGTIDFAEWYAAAHGSHSPWGGEEWDAVVTDAESQLERMLSTQIMRGGAKPDIRQVAAGTLVSEQGAPGDELFLVLDGMLEVSVDGESLCAVGPGAVLGERAILEGGRRTATLRATSDVKLAVASADHIDREALEALSSQHRHEEKDSSDES